jgi:hypothetical protein
MKTTLRSWLRRWLSDGGGIEPFLRALEPELSRRVREEHWSWESLALAFNRAGITYQSGRVWTARTLGNKIRDIRFKMRVRTSKAMSDARVNAPAAISAGIVGLPVVREMQDIPLNATTEDPEFKPATMLGWKRTATTDRTPVSVERTSATPEPVDVDAVIARLIGKK